MPHPPKPARPKTSFDGYCPCCRELIGWETLAKLFDGKILDADRELRTRIVCTNPKCDEVLQVFMLVDFQLTEVE